jgi:hypothetical protein
MRSDPRRNSRQVGRGAQDAGAGIDGGWPHRPHRDYHRPSSPMLALLLAPLLAWQDPTPPVPAGQPPAAGAPAAAAPAVPVVPIDDKAAKAAADALVKAFKGSPSMAEKNRALEELAGSSNRLLVRPLAQVVETDKSLVIRKRAAELIANQPGKETAGVLRKLMKNPKVAQHQPVLAELVRSLAKAGYEPAHWAELADLFESTFEPEAVPVQEAILTLAEQHKEKQAIPLLLRHIDEPAPENPHAADNPPAEYWKARWESWKGWRTKVKDALFAITGQRFSTKAEAEAWLKKNPRK